MATTVLVDAFAEDDSVSEHANDEDDSDYDPSYPRVVLRPRHRTSTSSVPHGPRPPTLPRIPDWVKVKYPGVRQDALKYGYKGVQIAPKKQNSTAAARYCANVNLGINARPLGRRRHSGLHVIR